MLSVGVDVGGTNIRAGLVDGEGRVLLEMSALSAPRIAPEEQFEIIARLVEDLLKKSGQERGHICGVGVGIPGVERDGFSSCINLFWVNVPFRAWLSRKLGMRVSVANDADCAAVAEHSLGACRGYSDAVVLTLGTGVGCGTILKGALLPNTEAGHTVLEKGGPACNCGRRGCFEQYASATALARMGAEAAAEDENSLLNKGDITAKSVTECAKAGDRAAILAFEKYTDYLAEGIINIVNMFSPKIVVLGGGVAKAGDMLFRAVREKTRGREIYPSKDGYVIAPAALDDTGVVGAAMLAQTET